MQAKFGRLSFLVFFGAIVASRVLMPGQVLAQDAPSPVEPPSWVPASQLPKTPESLIPVELQGSASQVLPAPWLLNDLLPGQSKDTTKAQWRDGEGQSKNILGFSVPPNTATRMDWVPSQSFSGLDVKTPVLVVNGAKTGPTLCLAAAVHGDEINGIEVIRQVMFGLDPAGLTGTVIGVPIVNLMAFARNSRYLPDRRDLNRFFPGSANGSLASRFAYAFFNDIIRHCDALVDLHTGSFHRTNLTQVRADLSVPSVSALAHDFGKIVVLNTPGNPNSLRAAAVTAGIAAVTVEAGEPLRMQKHVVNEGVVALLTLLKKRKMIDHSVFWFEPEPAFYQSFWVRVQSSGILFSQVKLGAHVMRGQLLGTVTNPITNEQATITSPYNGRVLGMALDQFVLPGFAAYHIGISNPGEPSITMPLDTEGFED
ncbi:succinylglutamate desuccinylase/aspartoacylase family protein [Marinagarivorans algicola]|uniref:succinylglutamate desuccinylase/aspartoacylase family protein n=1 Tax=Marinagarivorans algicola TaxID=1513270 RepID=UPI0006B993B1|nr:succinylglutamate desuccinylase/aspartoacylase family protein [Marinagarivorans algicola]